MFLRLWHPALNDGAGIVQLIEPIDFARQSAAFRRGQHTAGVLVELGVQLRCGHRVLR